MYFQILRDRISELPDDVLSFTLSFLPIREASRTSIISCRWRYLWKDAVKFSSGLTLDVFGIRDSEYTEEFLENKKLMSAERYRFVTWVDKILELDYGPSLHSFKLRFDLKNKFARHIDRWINMAIAKRVQKYDIDLSVFPTMRNCPDKYLYTIPECFFTEAMGALLKCLYLKSCILSPPNFNCFRSIVDIKLENVVVDQGILAKILSNCTDLEKLWLEDCWKLLDLTISISSLKLKELKIFTYQRLRDVKINARKLTRFEYYGEPLTFTFLNVPELSNLAMGWRGKKSASNLSYALGKLSSDVPQLETLFIVSASLKENMIPKPLSSYKNLRKLVVQAMHSELTLWGFIHLLHSSPFLHWLELHLFPVDVESESKCIAGQRRQPCDSRHLYLEHIVVTGFEGASHQIEFMKHLLRNCVALKKMTIDNYSQAYCPKRGLHNANCYRIGMTQKHFAEERKMMLDRAQAPLVSAVPAGVQLLFL
ncbi:hypothetical protein ACHQM5_012608 [Ranunculus cassubicifolius]